MERTFQLATISGSATTSAGITPASFNCFSTTAA
jgi:hypothetical protein